MNFEIIKLLKEFGKKDGEGDSAVISVDYGLVSVLHQLMS